MTYIAFFADGEHTFRLTKREIEELQVKCGSGIGAIANRLFARNFAQADINETIRLALVGGGMSAKRAHELVVAYVEGRPLIESYELAAKVLERTLCGNPHEKGND
ncbi:gene transfer agent family protein [Bradyrhizobium sp. cf659]|uniref:gene transfer agent family protein n=1 Tax=Bradyrhizobium sp. cf659 TaxID=1761771 RepID=UPI0008E3B585|nr:gene transfer agent family protein [Bradyrhizobium sp. cf659]SFH83334.1 Phage tail tube protein, GTA-gp10 [Bradyrhizobium sp. cf659]